MSKRNTSKPALDPSTTTPEGEARAPRRRAAKPAGENGTPKPRARKNTAAPAEVATADAHPTSETATITPTETVPAQAPTRPAPTHEEIAVRAYYIALERGFSEDPLNCWLRAERELMSA